MISKSPFHTKNNPNSQDYWGLYNITYFILFNNLRTTTQTLPQLMLLKKVKFCLRSARVPAFNKQVHGRVVHGDLGD